MLLAWSGGDQAAFERLAESVHGRLSRLASKYLREEREDHTLETGALVNEAFLRLVRQDRVSWHDRAHFFAISAKIMRRILVDHARRGGSSKRGGGHGHKILLEEIQDLSPRRPADVLALDDALNDLEQRDAELAHLVVMRYFGGLTKEEVAEALDVSPSTVARRWRTARAWLYSYLVDGVTDAL